jgi:hypothetical protein
MAATRSTVVRATRIRGLFRSIPLHAGSVDLQVVTNRLTNAGEPVGDLTEAVQYAAGRAATDRGLLGAVGAVNQPQFLAAN